MRATERVILRGHEGLAAPRRFVIKEDSAGGVLPVTLPVIHGGLVSQNLGAGVRTARVERRSLALRRRSASEHLARRGLIKPETKAGPAGGFQQTHRAEPYHARGA